VYSIKGTRGICEEEAGGEVVMPCGSVSEVLK